MNDEQMPPLPENELDTPPAGAEGLAGPLNEIDPEKLKQLNERLKAFKESGGLTVSGSEAVAEEQKAFDTSQFEVDPSMEHLYQRAKVEDTPEGAKWVVLEHQYMIQTGQWHIEGGGQSKGKDKHGREQYRAKGLDQIITEIINGPEGLLTREKGWRLSALLPGSMGQGIAVFERQVKRALPDPKVIVKPEEQPLEETGDEELARMQERAQGWTEGETGPPAVEGSSDQEVGEPDVPASGASDRIVTEDELQAAANAGEFDQAEVSRLLNEGGN